MHLKQLYLLLLDAIDQIKLNFDSGSLLTLNIVLGFLMLGVALELRLRDFKALLKAPKAPVIGLFAQFLLLPALTYGLTRIVSLPPSITLGMILVSSCPGGNVSNFITHLAKGNTGTSVSMTAVSTTAAIVMTPLNFSFWGSLHPETKALVTEVQLNALEMLGTMAILLGVPILLGIYLAEKHPAFAQKAQKPFKVITILFFGAFVSLAFSKNADHFQQVIGFVFLPVLLMNACAFALGYFSGFFARLPVRDRRAVAIEVGIQNSGLGLILVFNYFSGLGGMAIICAWWGIWHIVAGLALAAIWSRIPLEKPQINAA